MRQHFERSPRRLRLAASLFTLKWIQTDPSFIQCWVNTQLIQHSCLFRGPWGSWQEPCMGTEHQSRNPNTGASKTCTCSQTHIQFPRTRAERVKPLKSFGKLKRNYGGFPNVWQHGATMSHCMMGPVYLARRILVIHVPTDIICVVCFTVVPMFL